MLCYSSVVWWIWSIDWRGFIYWMVGIGLWTWLELTDWFLTLFDGWIGWSTACCSIDWFDWLLCFILMIWADCVDSMCIDWPCVWIWFSDILCLAWLIKSYDSLTYIDACPDCVHDVLLGSQCWTIVCIDWLTLRLLASIDSMIRFDSVLASECLFVLMDLWIVWIGFGLLNDCQRLLIDWLNAFELTDLFDWLLGMTDCLYS